MAASGERLLEVHNLGVAFPVQGRLERAVDGVSFDIRRGETVALVGESGCGKSVTSLAILRLIQPPGKVVSGSILVEGEDLARADERVMRRIRGNRISMIFQEPMTSLNPVFTVGDQIGEVFRIHRGASRAKAREEAIEMLRLVNIPAPDKRVDEYPHQLSGGMRQRIMIAMALACRPELLIADEPTTALDVTIQAQILDLIASLQRDLNMAVLLITHDLGVVASVCSRVLVMYAGRVVESGTVEAIFKNPLHPYTQGLLRSIPRLGQKRDRLDTIEGIVPALGRMPAGCRFQDRCGVVMDRCQREDPSLVHPSGDSTHQVACWRSPT